MKSNISVLCLFFIFALAALLRFWQLSDFPPSLSHDEVALGYNAYSMLITGKDEYGVSNPVLFRSFDDYKLPGYIYITILSEKIFGLNELGVRFPSALLGTITIMAFYFLVKELVSDRKDKILIAVLASFLLAINPWHINFSRAAFESNASLFFVVAGMLFLLKSEKKSWHFLFSTVLFCIAVYFYYTARVLIPLLLFTYFFLVRKEIARMKFWLIGSFFVGVAILSPLLPAMFGSGLSRISQVSIFEDQILTNPYSEAILRHDNSSMARIVYNRRFAYLQQFSDNFLKNFAPDYYFVNGTGPVGLLYLWELPFFFFGIIFLFKEKIRYKWIIIIWFCATALVGGITTGQPNALRTLPNAPIAVLFTSFGIVSAFCFIKEKKLLKAFAAVFFLVVGLFFVRFLYLYFDYYPRLSAKTWGDGYKQAVSYTRVNQGKYEKIVVSGYYWRPYIFFLFWSQYDPSFYQKMGTTEAFGKYYFGRASWDSEGIFLADPNLNFLELIGKIDKSKVLFILSASEYNTHEKKLIKLSSINGKFSKDVFVAAVLR